MLDILLYTKLTISVLTKYNSSSSGTGGGTRSAKDSLRCMGSGKALIINIASFRPVSCGSSGNR